MQKFDGDKLKELRKAKKLTREELSRALFAQSRIDITGQTIANIETGKSDPRSEDMAAIAYFFAKSILSLFKKTPDFLEARIKNQAGR